jgi:hypothetical protein
MVSEVLFAVTLRVTVQEITLPGAGRHFPEYSRTSASFAPSRTITHFFAAPSNWPEHRAARVSKRSKSAFAFYFSFLLSPSVQTLAYARGSVSCFAALFIFCFLLSAFSFCSSKNQAKTPDIPPHSSKWKKFFERISGRSL